MINLKIREEFPLLQKKIKGKPIIYFDNAATSLKPKTVIKGIIEYYESYSSNVHRGFYSIAEKATQIYEEAHEKTAKFINAQTNEIIFTKNTTESINLAANSLLESGFLKKGDEVLTTIMEHHSNFLPWKKLERFGIKVNIANITKEFELDLEDLKKKITKKTKLIAVTQAANTIGTINPIKEINKIAKENNCLILVDGAQSVPHMPVDVKKLEIDFLAFSAHKMLGPTGLGVLFGREELLNEMQPFLVGGGMISKVTLNKIEFAKPFEKFEAGTPPIAEAFGFIKAIEFLERIGMKNIRENEVKLNQLMLKEFEEMNEVKLYCPKNPEKQVSNFLFRIEKIHPHDIASLLDELNNICIRAGMHCAEPLLRQYSNEGFARASLYFYNTKEEIKIFAETLKKIIEMMQL